MSKHRPLLIAFLTLVILDFAGIATMIISPKLTERVIPALMLVQLVGLISIAVIRITRSPKQWKTSDATPPPTSPSRDWRIWFICFMAMLFFFRAFLALPYMAGDGWRGNQVYGPLAGFGICIYLLFLANALYRHKKKRLSAPPPPA
jgi:hypothetical protein